MCQEKDRDTYDAILASVEGATIDDQLLTDVLTSLKNKKLAYDLALVSLDVSEGRSSVERIFDTINQFEQKTEVENFEFVTTDISQLYESTLHQQGLRWRLDTLNKMMGSLRKGDFGFVFC